MRGCQSVRGRVHVHPAHQHGERHVGERALRDHAAEHEAVGGRRLAGGAARIVKSISRLAPNPRGRRPSIAATTMGGAIKASDSVMRIERSLLAAYAGLAPTPWQSGSID